MNLKQKATEKLRECDFINDEILKLRRKEQSIRLEISNIKKSIEMENLDKIGKRALCTNSQEPSFKNIECICTSVICTDSFDISPRFSYKGKKVHVDYFDWL